MHPLVAEDFAKVLVQERIREVERRAQPELRGSRRRLRAAVGTALVRAGVRLGRLDTRSAVTARR